MDEQTVLGPIDVTPFCSLFREIITRKFSQNESQAFTFANLKGQVQFAECSVTEDKVDDVLKFVQNLCS